MKMTKRMLLVALVLVGLFSFSCGVSAANLTAYVTVSNQGAVAVGNDTAKTLMAAVPVTVTANEGVATVDAVLKAAHEKYCPNGYEVSPSGVTKLWNQNTYNCLFAVNGMGIENGVAVDTVKDGDSLVVSINKDNTYYADWLTAFDVNRKEVALGQNFTLTLKGHLGMAFSPEDKADIAIAGCTVGTVSENGTFEAMKGKVTNEQGQVTLSFDKAGTYVISARGTVADEVTDWSTMSTLTVDCPMIAPVCIVTVGFPVTAVVNADAQFGNEFLVAPLTVKVSADTAERFGYADAVSPLKNVSALDVLVALHQYKYADFSMEKAASYFDMSDSGWINKIWNGAEGSACYIVNGKNDINPANSYGYMVNEAPVKNGDCVEFFQCLDAVNYADECAWFTDGTQKLNRVRAEAGKDLELSVNSYTFMWYSSAPNLADYQNPVSGLTIGIWQDGKIVDLTGKDGKTLTTDENGKVKVNFPAKGNYTVVAYCADKTKYYSLPAVNISVYDAVQYDDLKDLKKGTWYESSVNKILQNGLMVGTSATAFSPNAPLTRGMCVEILYRFAGCPAVMTENPFKDVSAKDYYYNAVNWAYETEITSGVSATAFAPNANITREQMAVFMNRYLTVSGVELGTSDGTKPFADDAQISSFAKESVYRLAENGLLKGKGNQIFGAKDGATRAEFATLIARLSEK